MTVAAGDDEPRRPPLWDDPYGDGPRGYPYDPEIDPCGYGNPHRGGCKLCGALKRAVPTRGGPAGYFLVRMCEACDLRGSPIGSMLNMPNMHNTGESIMGRSEYSGYRRRHTPIAPVRVFIGCLVFGWVCGLLFIGLPWVAALGVAAYLIFGGRAGGQAPGAGTLLWAGALLLGCAAYVGLAEGRPLSALWYALPAAIVIGTAALFGRPVGRGGPIGRRSGEYPADRRNGR